MGIGCRGPELSGEGPAEAGRGGVSGRRGADEPTSGHPPLVWKENCKWREVRFCAEHWHGSVPEAVGDPPLHLPPMDFHLVKKSFGGCEQVSAI